MVENWYRYDETLSMDEDFMIEKVKDDIVERYKRIKLWEKVKDVARDAWYTPRWLSYMLKSKWFVSWKYRESTIATCSCWKEFTYYQSKKWKHCSRLCYYKSRWGEK